MPYPFSCANGDPITVLGAASASVAAIQSGYILSQPSIINCCRSFRVCRVLNAALRRTVCVQICKHDYRNDRLGVPWGILLMPAIADSKYIKSPVLYNNYHKKGTSRYRSRVELCSMYSHLSDFLEFLYLGLINEQQTAIQLLC